MATLGARMLMAEKRAAETAETARIQRSGEGSVEIRPATEFYDYQAKYERDDTVYLAYSERMPERGTKVILHLRPWKKGDGWCQRVPPRTTRASPVGGPRGSTTEVLWSAILWWYSSRRKASEVHSQTVPWMS